GTVREQRAAFVAHLLMESPVTKPRTRFLYSNAGYGLLGYIAERLTDKSFEQAMRDEVFAPLGLTSAAVGMPQEVRNPPGWTGHLRTPRGFEAVIPPREGLPALMPAGLMSCTIQEFAKISALLCEIEAGTPTDFISPATAMKLPELRPGPGGEGGILFGGDGHYTAAFALWPSKGLAIVVQSNAGDSDDLCEAMLNAVREVVAPDVPAWTAGTAPQDPDRPRFGFQIRADDDTWLIVGVVPDSPAAKGGLKAGDQIMAINGIQLTRMPEDDRMIAVGNSPLKLDIDRNGKSVRVTLVLR
ncbi:MAG: serine hydrolase, partial [Planctomycetes bacterium]|nr:serine hydrolase [Planctomycetota bacterium]